MDSSDATTKPAKGGPSRGLLIGGLVAIVVIAGVIVSTNNSDAPRSGAASCATTPQGCKIGDVGPGGGKVFSLGSVNEYADCSSSTITCLEVAPRNWSGSSDPQSNWTTATTSAAAYGTPTAGAGSWLLPTQSNLNDLATSAFSDPTDAFGFVDSTSLYWSSGTSSYFDNSSDTDVPTAFARNRSSAGAQKRQTVSYYARPIHPF